MNIYEGTYFFIILPSSYYININLKTSSLYKILNYKNISLSVIQPIIIPKFLYSIDINSSSIMWKNPSLEYPPLPYYKRNQFFIEIKPTDYKFFKDSCIVFIDKISQQKENIQINVNKKNSLEIPLVFQEKYKQQLNFCILLKQDFYYYLLEEVSFDNKNFSIEDSIKNYKPYSYLSIKDLLAPEDGLKRIYEDIMSNQYKGAQKTSLMKFLNLVKVATKEEEIIIMENIYKSDQAFFNFIVDACLTDDLLPYMDKNELYNIINKINDSVLANILNYPHEVQIKYKPYLSKNRWNCLSKHKQSPNEELSLKTKVWLEIEDAYRNKKPTYFYIPQDSYTFLNLNESLEKVDCNKKFLPHSYIGLYSCIKILRHIDYQYSLLIVIEEKLLILDIYFEFQKFQLEKKSFRNLNVGILVLNNIYKLPLKIIFGGMNYKRELIESLFILKD